METTFKDYLQKGKNWLNSKPNFTNMELYSSMLVGAVIANALLDWFK